MALEQSAWELMAIGMGLLKDREVLIDSARLLSIVVKRLLSRRLLANITLNCRLAFIEIC